jgi:hypothetical protein
MVNVTNRAYIDMRFRSFKFFLRHLPIPYVIACYKANINYI